jgi:hypothetical protein
VSGSTSRRWVVALLLVLAAARCVPEVQCTPENCNGCCDEGDHCLPGSEVAACGKQGSACISCAPSTCNANGTCFLPLEPLDGGDYDGSLTFLDGGGADAGEVDAGTSDAGDVDAGVTDAGAPDAGPRDAGTPDAGAPDAGPRDAGTPDAGTPDSGIVPVGIRFANFSGSTLDFCVWSPGQPIPTQAAFHPAGVASGTVSNYFPFPGQVAAFNFLMVPPGSGCVTDAGFNVTSQPGSGAAHRTRWYTRTGSPLGGGMLEDLVPDPTAESVLFTQMMSINAAVRFVPDSDGGVDAGPPISISPTARTLLPAGVPGVLEGNVPGQGVPPPRPFLGQAGGVVRIFMTGTEILVCDNLAPPVGDQSDCRPSVRAP